MGTTASVRVPLPARTDVAALAWSSVTAASSAAAALTGSAAVELDPERIAVAYSSERHFRIDGAAPRAFAPLSAFFRTSDGWVRTHANYPHHAAALRRSLSLTLDATAEDVADRVASLRTDDVVATVTEARGLAVAVSPEVPETDAAWRATPLVREERIGDAAPRSHRFDSPAAPLRGVRVLDLTRVIAGPVATRTLALLGADVLRVDPPHLPEPRWQHLDTGNGKRSTLLDLLDPQSRETFDALLSTADIVVTGYRAKSIDALGLSPASLADRAPGLVIARLTAWGSDGEAAARRGFDSLVQAESGIALIESPDGDRPGVLPAQALDHSAGYLLAAGVMTALLRQSREGGTWLVETSLRRIAAELLGLPRSAEPRPPASDSPVNPYLQSFDVRGRVLTSAAPAIAYEGGPTSFEPPRAWGMDEAVWLAR